MRKSTYLHQWGWPPHYYDPPAPLPPRDLAKLGDALDKCEGQPDWRIEGQDAELDYQIALRDRVWHRLRKFERAKITPSRDDVRRAGAEIEDAEFEMRMAVTARELLDARAASEIAQGRREIAKRKHSAARRRAAADERAGKNLITLRGMVFHRTKKTRKASDAEK